MAHDPGMNQNAMNAAKNMIDNEARLIQYVRRAKQFALRGNSRAFNEELGRISELLQPGGPSPSVLLRTPLDERIRDRYSILHHIVADTKRSEHDLRPRPLSFELLRTLLQALPSADIDVVSANPDARGQTLLIHAADHDVPVVVLEMLFRKGANLNLQDDTGKTGLMYATIRNNHQNILWFREKGADAEIRNKQGATASNYAHPNNMDGGGRGRRKTRRHRHRPRRPTTRRRRPRPRRRHSISSRA